MDPVDGKGFPGVTDGKFLKPSGNADYFIGTGTGYEEVSQLFRDSEYFEESEGSDLRYSAPGIDVEVTWKGIAYNVDKQADKGAADEFLQEIVRSFDDVDEEFFSEVEQAVYNSTREVIADGGTLEDVDHNSPYELEEGYDGVQESMKRGDETSGIPLTGSEHSS